VRCEPVLPHARFWPAIPVRLPECDECGVERDDVRRCAICDAKICSACVKSDAAFDLGVCNSADCLTGAVRRMKQELRDLRWKLIEKGKL
jgi:hypothetical protein